MKIYIFFQASLIVILITYLNYHVYKIADNVSIKLLKLSLILPWVIMSVDYVGIVSLFFFVIIDHFNK